MTFDPDISDLLVHLDRAEVKFEGKNHRRKFTIAIHGFGYGCNRLIEKKLKLGETITAQCRKMQVVTTLCRFQCAVAEVCTLPSAVALVGCLSSYLFFYLLT